MFQHDTKKSTPLPFILAQLGTSEQDLCRQGIAPQALVSIYNDYTSRQQELHDVGAFITSMLSKVEGVHSVRYRVKDPVHLLQKIIRKKKEYPDRHFSRHSYLGLINDLVGVRVLHLYKESWVHTSNFIQQVWQLKRTPYAYIKGNEDEQNLRSYAAHGCRIMTHPSAYKAVHFVVETQPGKQRYFAEVQLRTIFEEGWSEIDHNIRYPDHINSEVLSHLLQLLNKLTSHADDLASLIQKLAYSLGELPPDHELNPHGQEDELLYIQSHIAKLPFKKTEKQQLYKSITRALRRDHL